MFFCWEVSTTGRSLFPNSSNHNIGPQVPGLRYLEVGHFFQASTDHTNHIPSKAANRKLRQLHGSANHGKSRGRGKLCCKGLEVGLFPNFFFPVEMRLKVDGFYGLQLDGSKSTGDKGHHFEASKKISGESSTDFVRRWGNLSAFDERP